MKCFILDTLRYCSFSCKDGYVFEGVTDTDMLFVCDVNSGFNEDPVTPPCIGKNKQCHNIRMLVMLAH